MIYTKLGKTGLDISRICLGCMTFGEPNRGNHNWTLPMDGTRPIIRKAIELGINFFDTANVYSDGSSEEIVGQLLREFGRRDDLVIASKVHGMMRKGPNGAGLSRKAIMTELDHSLKRLGTDYIDLYQIHRWDYKTPIAETMEALHDVVKAGKVRYIGASSMYAWQFAKALYVAEKHGWTRFVTMQNHYNLIYREEEREMNPLCLDEGIGLLPWSPYARGRLTRQPGAETDRTRGDAFAGILYDKKTAAVEEADQAVITAVGALAEKRGVSRAQVALGWMLTKPVVSAPIIGASKVHQLDDAIAALELSRSLTTDEIATLEAPYIPHPVAGFA
ncbi:MAG: aldo/keto reductase [Candidatus Methylacidiphilales bacterium]|nr:aldo/keto reductase [Candidatus Methylacidiphilales bacterium]